MRRTVLLLCAAAAVTAGCGDDPAPPTRIKVSHASGQAQVPAGGARRVVTLTTGALDAALALGIRPVGAATAADGRVPRYLRTRARGIPTVGSSFALDLGAIRSLHPDLLLGSKARQGTLYAKLRAIAPTVNSYEGEDWQLDLRLYGEALRRIPRVERVLRAVDRRAASARAALRGAAARTLAAVRVLPGETQLAGRRSFAAEMLEAGGLRTVGPRGELSRISPHALGVDLVLISANPDAESRLAPLLEESVWGAVPRRVDDDVWWVGNGPLAAEAALGELVRVVPR